jgi:hypothetical protein
MSLYDHNPKLADRFLTRRQLLQRTGMGLGALALGDLMTRTGAIAAPSPSPAAINPLYPKGPHFAPRAKRIIHLFMNGGPSQVDTFDPKPSLTRFHGKTLPGEYLRTERKTGAAFKSPYTFQKYGQSGIEVSEIFRHTAQSVDDMCIIRSMYADVPNHEPSLLLMNCGDARQIRPSMGSWLTYGLGTDNQNLPGFVVMCPNGYPIQESQNWQCGFLPGIYQGTYIDTKHTDIEKLIEHIRNKYEDRTQQRRQLDLLMQLNEQHAKDRQRDAQLESRIQSYELAYRMQTEASDAFDISKEPQHIRDMYGADKSVQARQILIARRLAERGVRYIQVWHGEGQPWDSHDDIEVNHRRLASQCDQAIGALLKDLKQRGLLEDTIVMWGGEFGRTPVVELPTPGANAGKINGRDHNHWGFTYWLAGGGVKGGYVHGATDEFGFRAQDNKVHVHDLHATLLKLMGFDHEKFTYRHAGRDFRLTDVHGNVVNEIIA